MAKKPEQRTRSRPKPTQRIPRPRSTSEEIDQELADKAREKRRRGEKPTKLELQALKKVDDEEEEKFRWYCYETIPKKHWEKMAGRSIKVINEQARYYGFPLVGGKIDLPAFVQCFHKFLVENWRKLRQNGTEGGKDGNLERYRSERAKAARMDNLEREQVLIRRDQVHEALGRFATILRGAAELLQKQFGQEAYEILSEALVDAEQEVKFFEDDNGINLEEDEASEPVS